MAFFLRSFDFFVNGRFLVGGAGPNVFFGGFAGDRLDGGGGNDILHGLRGNDLLIGGAGADVIFGGSGDDTVVADTEDLLLNGGRDGNGAVADTNNGDTLDLSDVAEGVFVDLDINFAGAPNPGLSQEGAVRNIGVVSGGPETFNIRAVDFENVIGTEFADRLFGNAEANVLEGRGGDDVFHAFAGNDIYDGGEGVDTALFVQAAVGIVADLAAGTVEAGPDLNTLIDIENLTGGVFGDVILGDAAVNALSGNGGSDVLNGREGEDVLTGGEGSDSFLFDASGIDGGLQDSITDFETGVGGDAFHLDFAAFGVAADTVSFDAIDATEALAGTPTGTELDGANVIVLLNTDDDGDAATAFNARSAAQQIAELTEEDGAGFFVYFNSGLGVNRLVRSEDLNDGDAGLEIIARLDDIEAGDLAAAEAQLDAFVAENFSFDTSLDFV
ncbi:MAG: calcium-binding protein [Pseudomonadota bacterium]